MTRSRAPGAHLLALAALLCSTAACTADHTARASATADPPVAWTVADSTALRAGTTEADGLVTVASAVTLPGGGIAVADGGTHRIDVFDGTGRRVRTLGREGRGPGEFSYPSWIGLRGDTLRVWDMVQARLTLFDTAGALIRTEPPVTDLGSFPRVAGEFEDGSLLLLGAASEAWRAGVFRDSLLLVRMSFANGTRDTLGRVPGDEQFGSRSPDGRTVQTATRPFGRRTVIAVRGDRTCVGTGDTPEILCTTDGNAWSRAAAVPAARRRVSRTDIDEYWARLITRGARAGSDRERPEGLTYPAEYPPYADLVAPAGGGLWVALPARPAEWSQGTRWLVFAPDGAARGSVFVPGRTRLLEVGDGWILVAETDAEDRQVVARYPLSVPRP